jgi:hypothetical protein
MPGINGRELNPICKGGKALGEPSEQVPLCCGRGEVADQSPAVECAVCGQQMKHLANLKSTAGLEALRVYRCYSCDHVLQREW